MELNLQLFAEGEEGTEQQATLTGDEEFEESYYSNPDEGEDEEEEDIEEPEGEDEEGEDIEEPNQPFKNQHNADMAAMRRRQEEAQRIQAARDAAFAEAYGNQVNPYTNQPIRTEQDFRAYQEAFQRDQLQQAGLDPNIINQMVSNHPMIRQAQEALAQQKIAQQQQAMVAGLQEISRIDPDIKTFEDILANPNFAQIDAMYQRGYSLSDAYKLANMEKITQRKQAAAKQTVINQTTGKSHMQQTSGRGTGNDVQIPADVMAMYHEMMPNATDKEIRAHYKRTHKE